MAGTVQEQLAELLTAFREQKDELTALRKEVATQSMQIELLAAEVRSARRKTSAWSNSGRTRQVTQTGRPKVQFNTEVEIKDDDEDEEVLYYDDDDEAEDDSGGAQQSTPRREVVRLANLDELKQRRAREAAKKSAEILGDSTELSFLDACDKLEVCVCWLYRELQSIQT